MNCGLSQLRSESAAACYKDEDEGGNEAEEVYALDLM